MDIGELLDYKVRNNKLSKISRYVRIRFYDVICIVVAGQHSKTPIT